MPKHFKISLDFLIGFLVVSYLAGFFTFYSIHKCPAKVVIYEDKFKPIDSKPIRIITDPKERWGKK